MSLDAATFREELGDRRGGHREKRPAGRLLAVVARIPCQDHPVAETPCARRIFGLSLTKKAGQLQGPSGRHRPHRRHGLRLRSVERLGAGGPDEPTAVIARASHPDPRGRPLEGRSRRGPRRVSSA